MTNRELIEAYMTATTVGTYITADVLQSVAISNLKQRKVWWV